MSSRSVPSRSSRVSGASSRPCPSRQMTSHPPAVGWRFFDISTSNQASKRARRRVGVGVGTGETINLVWRMLISGSMFIFGDVMRTVGSSSLASLADDVDRTLGIAFRGDPPLPNSLPAFETPRGGAAPLTCQISQYCFRPPMNEEALDDCVAKMHIGDDLLQPFSLLEALSRTLRLGCVKPSARCRQGLPHRRGP
jgi:hypothetical protein